MKTRACKDIVITKNGVEVAKPVIITPNADFLYGLLANSKNKDITKKQILEERIKEKYGRFNGRKKG